jgi:beta-lactamase regulating signal transducer with metallopeptidase domain
MTPTEIAGLALLHFIWQGSLVALATAAALWLARRRTPAVRYVLACGGLAVMLACPVVTGYRLASGPSPIVVAGEAAPGSTMVRGGLQDDPVKNGATAIGFVRVRAGGWPEAARLLTLIAWFWAAGVGLLTMRMAAGCWRIRHLHRLGLATDASTWQGAAYRLAARLHVRTAVHVVEMTLVDSPAVVGWLKPVILLPVAALASLSPAQVEAILAHELAHVRRHDFLVNLVQTIAETLLFYHPAVWWLSARIRAEREHACDDAALAICGDRGLYADALVRLEAGRHDRPLVAPAATGGLIAVRVRRILGLKTERPRRPSSPAIAVCLALVIVATNGVYSDRQSSARGASQALPQARFDWHILGTDHADIYYRPGDDAVVQQIANATEIAYAQLRSVMRHELSFRVSVVVTLEAAEFQAVAASGGAGFVPYYASSFHPGPDLDKSLPRMLVPLDAFEEDPSLVAHEMTHMFTFDILPMSRLISPVPPWLPEGLAHHVAGVWTAEGEQAARDAVASGFLPSQVSQSLPALDDRMRHLGHAIFDFMDQEYGQAGIRRFLLALRAALQTAAPPDGPSAYHTAFGITPEDFDRDFYRFMLERFRR